MPPIAATAERPAAGGTVTPVPPPLMPLVVRDLTYVAGGKAILDGVSLRLETGARTVILGPNGAGKSVLLRLCHGLLEPTAGHIRWGGLDPATARSRQSMVFQRPVLLRRSVAANIEHVLKVKGVARAHRLPMVTEALAGAGLASLARQPARTLSGGEQQRLAIARARVTAPDVLLLDEPTSSLDPDATRAVEELIRAIEAAGTKIIMTTHDLGQARRLADEVLFLNRGRLLEHSAAAEFFRRPRDPLAARFLSGSLLT
jgi:tungstate transport system ATP-binding protein